ncbi:MAG: imidazole glycerol phosphate synthase subunit HisF [Geminicoccaceae bacterium]
MLTSRIIPCLDVSDGRIVKGVKFQGLRDAGDPAERAWLYQDHGADEIVILDVSATPEGRGHQYEVVRRVRAGLSIPLTVGGGVRELGDAEALLDAGADKVSINTAAVAEPALVDAISATFGAQCAVVAIDAAWRQDRFEVLTHGGRTPTGIDAVAWAKEVADRGAGEILLTSWDRDGTGEGYDVPLIEAVAGASRLPVIASGGASGPDHLIAALQAGADAVLAASIFHDDKMTVADVKAKLAEAGIEVRR